MDISKRNYLMGSAIVGLLGVGNVVYAGPHCKHGGGKQGKYSHHNDQDRSAFMQNRFKRMASKLSLSETQQTQVQALRQNHQNTMKPLRNEKRGLRKEMRLLDPTATDYSAKLADIANRKAELTRQMTIAGGNKRQQMSLILTPEQLAKKQAMRVSRKDRHHRMYQQ